MLVLDADIAGTAVEVGARASAPSSALSNRSRSSEATNYEVLSVD